MIEEIAVDDGLALLDIEARVLTEGWLEGREEWPYEFVLPLCREIDGDVETGYVIRERASGPVSPLVMADGLPSLRRYESRAQLLAAGWRVD